MPSQPRCPFDTFKEEWFAFFAKHIAAYSSRGLGFACEWSFLIKQRIQHASCLEENLLKDLLMCKSSLMSELKLFLISVYVLRQGLAEN